MPGESPTKWQAQAYRFGVRRLESAVASGDPLLRGAPSRRRSNISLIVSVILAALILGGFAVYGFVRPQPTIGTAAVVIDSDTGGVFVSRGGRLYPAMNLSSALLAAGRGQRTAPSTTTVDTGTVARTPRGPLLGIPAAPDVLPRASELVDPLWTVCDQATVDTALAPGSTPAIRTIAIIGERKPRDGSLGRSGALLVSADNGATSFLVWGGRRSKIDPADGTIRLALGLGADTPVRPISAALLNVIPERADLVVPSIVTSGAQPAYAASLGVRVGDVFGLKRADRTRSVYVALPDGFQQITPLVAELIRDQFDLAKTLPLVAPRLLRQSPRSAHPIDLTSYPTTRPQIHGVDPDPVACVARSGSTQQGTEVFARTALPMPQQAQPVTVTQPGALTVDSVYLHPGRGALLSSATQSQPAGIRTLFVITDEGVAYPVVSQTALTYLGFAAKDVRRTAPELLGLLPRGPTLDPDAAVRFYPQTGASAGSLPTASSTSGGP